jgi:CheY-like chemotaxis protein
MTRCAVLVVDDEPVYSGLVSLLLAEAGIETVLASSAADALALLEANPPALILSDYAMPVASGLDLLEVTRERWPEIPFVLWSGSLSEEIARRAGELGAHATQKLVGEPLRALVRSLLAAAEPQAAGASGVRYR